MNNPAKDVLIVEEPLQPFAEIVHAVIAKPFDFIELGELVKGCVPSRQRIDGFEGVPQ